MVLHTSKTEESRVRRDACRTCAPQVAVTSQNRQTITRLALSSFSFSLFFFVFSFLFYPPSSSSPTSVKSAITQLPLHIVAWHRLSSFPHSFIMASVAAMKSFFLLVLLLFTVNACAQGEDTAAVVRTVNQSGPTDYSLSQIPYAWTTLVWQIRLGLQVGLDSWICETCCFLINIPLFTSPQS